VSQLPATNQTRTAPGNNAAHKTIKMFSVTTPSSFFPAAEVQRDAHPKMGAALN
jgi:hypothetical protein